MKYLDLLESTYTKEDLCQPYDSKDFQKSLENREIDRINLSEERAKGFAVDRDGSPSPFWLESIRGSTSLERSSSEPKNFNSYNRKVRKARKLANKELTLENLLLRENEFLMKLSALEAWYPSTTFEFYVNIQDLVKSNMKLLRSFLVYYIHSEVPSWIEYLIEEGLDRILKQERLKSGGKTFRENFIIRQTYILRGKQECLRLLEEIYSKDNLSKWYRTGKNLCKSFEVIKIPYARVKEKVRRRGYHESSTNKFKTKSFQKRRKENPVMVIKSPEAQELEQVRERILLKQAKLFEQRLNRYLEIENPETTPERRKELFNSLVQAEFLEDQVTDSSQSNKVSTERSEGYETND